MLKSISDTSLKEMNLGEKLLDRNKNVENENGKKILKTVLLIFGILFVVGYLIFIIISYNT